MIDATRVRWLIVAALLPGWGIAWSGEDDGDDRPNILLAIADDWGWPHAGAYGDRVVQTPNFDRVAREGILFRHAFVSSPSCTPSRNALLTGQWHWRLEAGANLWSTLPDRFTTYPELLRAAGYWVGSTGKAFGPGKTETPGRPLAGKRFRDFASFLAERPPNQPFCFWLGSGDPHRPYEIGSGAASGIELNQIRLPACFPDAEEVRGDIADYYWEVQRFDRLVGDALQQLERIDEFDNTIVVITGDHGMPFPRAKSNLYDTGTRVPLAMRWPTGMMSAGRTLDEFVSLTDLAPTFLAAAGVSQPAEITGRSLLPLLRSDQSGHVQSEFNDIIFGKERHVPSQEAPDMGGYPCRALRTANYLYIMNLRPDRWPNGTPNYQNAAMPGTWYGDTDNGPTKHYMIENREADAHHARLYELSFAKRPADELYDLRTDPVQLNNVASNPNYADIVSTLKGQLTERLARSGDPRFAITSSTEVEFDHYPYLGGGPRFPAAGNEK